MLTSDPMSAIPMVLLKTIGHSLDFKTELVFNCSRVVYEDKHLNCMARKSVAAQMALVPQPISTLN